MATGNLVPVGDVEQVVRDLNDVLVTHAGYLRMSAQERQDAYDAALLTGGVVVMLYTTGQMRNEEALAAQARSMARQILIDVFRWRGN